MDQYQEYIHKSRYARYDYELGRRETWKETVSRYIKFWVDRGQLIDGAPITKELFDGIYNMEVMPSMRCMMTAGPALERDNVAGFNCSYLPINNIRCFDELMYILLCGTGVGYSVERQEVASLPEVSETMHPTDTVIVVSDSKVGWASSVRQIISLLYGGHVPTWDVSRIRPKGAVLKTFGGRASGPEPLVGLFEYLVSAFSSATGRRLTSLEAHDIVCKIADVVVVGGVRRSALICLSNLSDDRMRKSKMGNWTEDNGHRALANNSICFTEKPDYNVFLDEVNALHQSFAGERGFFSRPAVQNIASKNGRRDPNHEFGTNPCSEIILRPFQFCNLSENIVRSTDNLDDLKRKVRLSTVLGTLQATLTDFRYLRKIWSNNTKEEALLGVSLTGICDHPLLNNSINPKHLDDPDMSYIMDHFFNDDDKVCHHPGDYKGDNIWLSFALSDMKKVAIDTNLKWSKKLGINQAAAITCVKPSGTVSQLTDTASGIHPRHSKHYIRTVRSDIKDPLAQYMVASGFPYEPCERKPLETLIFSFPIAAPDECITRDNMGTMDQLKLWSIYQEDWCEHKPSITVYYTDETFMAAMDWSWNNFNTLSGISFLPYDGGIYKQAPYQECDADTYEEAALNMPNFDWDEFHSYESEDNTTGMQELACTGGACEI